MSDPSKKERIAFALGMIDSEIINDVDVVAENILEQTCFEDYLREKSDKNKRLDEAIFNVGLSVLYKEWLKL